MPDRRLGPLVALARRTSTALGALLAAGLLVYVQRDSYRDANGTPIGLVDALYYATVSLSTTGYGDIVPVTETARLWTILAITPLRVLFLIVLVGTTVELLTERSRQAFRISRWRSRVRDHVVVVGFGTKGQAAVDTLRSDGAVPERIVVVDIDRGRLDAASTWGLVTVRGDATRSSVLRTAALVHAASLVVAVNRDDTAVLVTLTARELAPGIAITAAAGASVLWRRRASLGPRVVLAVVVVGTAIWSALVLTQHDWLPWLRWVLVVAGALGAVGLLVPPGRSRGRGLGVVAVLAALLAALGGSTAFALVTAVTPHQGSIVSAGPTGGIGGPGGRGDSVPGRDGGDGRRGFGGSEGETPSPALVALVRQGGTRWAAATTGAMTAAPLELASGVPVMAIGGFMGSDPAPTLAQFQADVATGQVRWFVEGGPGGDRGPGGRGGPGGVGPEDRGPGGGGPGGRGGTSREISTWVTAHFTPIDVGGRTVYDLAGPTR